MKLSLLAFGFGLCVSAGLLPVQADVSVGDREFEVIEALGKPTGYIGSHDFQIYYFDRGEVIFREGIVQSHTIVPEEEAERRREAAARERQAREEREEEEREKRIAEGLAIKDEKTSDPQFNDLSPTARLAFWHTFRQKYPEVDVDLEYSIAYHEARKERAEEIAQVERERRLNELERRVMEAEHQAELAEREARYAREQRKSRYYHDSYVHYHPRPPVVIHHFPHHKEKKVKEHSSDTTVVRRHTEVRSSPRAEQFRHRMSEEGFMFPPLKDNF